MGRRSLMAVVTIVFSVVALSSVGLAPALASTSSATVTCAPPPASSPGFNQCGYNWDARVFSGPADGVDDTLDGTIYGDPTYANDYLVMKWNAAWDACNANGWDDPTYCAGAWLTNEWNGMVPGGSGTTEHVKVIWVGSAGEASSYWVPGGYSIWGNYEAISDQGMTDHQHYVAAAAIPQGLG